MELGRTLSTSLTKLTNSVQLTTKVDKKYLEPAQSLEKACNVIFGEKYAITLVPPSKSAGTPLRLKIVPHDSRILTTEEIIKNKNEIYYGLISQLKERLGDDQFKKLVTKCQGKGQEYYIDLSLGGLESLGIDLASFAQNAETSNLRDIETVEAIADIAQNQISQSIPLLIMASHSILGGAYALDIEERFFEYDPTNGTHSGPRVSVMLKVKSANGNSTNLDSAEIRLTLVQELRRLLGGNNFRLLVNDNGKAYGRAKDDSFFMDLNLSNLPKLNSVLNTMANAVCSESLEQKKLRELEVQTALEAEVELYALMEQEPDVSLKEDFKNMREIFARFHIAYEYDAKFRNALQAHEDAQWQAKLDNALRNKPESKTDYEVLQEFPPKKTLKFNAGIDFADNEYKFSCFKIYLNINRHHYCTIREIFNSIDPKRNRYKYDAHFDYCDQKADEFSNNADIQRFYLANRANVTNCFEYLYGEEMKYTLTADSVMVANTLVIGQLHQQKAELRFEEFHSDSQTIGGEVTTVLVKLYGNKNGIVHNVNDYHAKVISPIMQRLGQERFERLAPKYVAGDPETCVALDGSVYLECAVNELSMIKLGELIPLSEYDVKMYREMLNVKDTASDTVSKLTTKLSSYKTLLGESWTSFFAAETQANKDRFNLDVKRRLADIARTEDALNAVKANESILSLYEIYVRFRLTNLDNGSTIALGLDKFDAKEFIRFIMQDPYLLSAVNQTFDNTSIENRDASFAFLMEYCGNALKKIAAANEELSNWYSAMQEVIKCGFLCCKTPVPAAV